MNSKESQNADIDYDDWATKAYWTIDEALGLALDIDPDRQMGPLKLYRNLLDEPWESTADPALIEASIPGVSEIFSGWRAAGFDVSEKFQDVVFSLMDSEIEAREELTNLGIDDIDSTYNDLTALREKVMRAIEARVLPTLPLSSDKLIPSDFVQWAEQSKQHISDRLINAVKTMTGGDQTLQQRGGESTKKRWNERENEIVKLANEIIRDKKLSGCRGDLTKLAKETHKLLSRLITKTTEWTVPKNFEAIRNEINGLIAEKRINWWNPN